MNLQRIYYTYRHNCSRERTGIELKNGLWKMKNEKQVSRLHTLHIDKYLKINRTSTRIKAAAATHRKKPHTLTLYLLKY